jgi:hypothetical protein
MFASWYIQMPLSLIRIKDSETRIHDNPQPSTMIKNHRQRIFMHPQNITVQPGFPD